MFTNKVEVLSMAAAMAAHAAARQNVIARNVANADTPGFRARRLPDFAEVWQAQGQTLRGTRAGHLSVSRQREIQSTPDSRNLSPNGNSVSLETEMVAAAEARQAHDFALAIRRTLSGAIRTALGRR
ncbi:MAG: FlgB family protein [Gemmobacter sp.]|nr:FlgB family protein [Gemmobacter sp.]